MSNYIVAVTASSNEKTFKQTLEFLKGVALKGEISYDTEFLFKMPKGKWDELAQFCITYGLNGTVLTEVN